MHTTLQEDLLIIEAIFFALKHRFGETLRSRTWFGQFREFALKAAVRTIEQTARH